MPTKLIVQLVACAQNLTCSEAYALQYKGDTKETIDLSPDPHAGNCSQKKSATQRRANKYMRSLYRNELIVNSRKNEEGHRKQTEKLSSFWTI